MPSIGTTDFKVLDPACGSGIFLVGAFKRLIFRWREKNNWKKPPLDVMKKLLKDNIFGVDKSEEAVRLTAFSICLALCDMLSPIEIWDKLKFDNLFGSNLFSMDFFKLIEERKLDKTFDMVIGNPPFVSKIDTPSAKRIESERKKVRPDIPDNQVSLLFLDQAIKFCKYNGLLCLILPAGPFLYNNHSYKYREWFLSQYNTLQILDFTPLQRILFGSSEVATVALFAKKEKPKNKYLLHITIRRTKSSKEKIFFEIDYYDFLRINYNEALKNRYVWKSNLLGGGRLEFIIDRLSSMRKLGSYLEEKCNDEGWAYGEGYTIGNKKEIKKLEILEENVTQLSDMEYRSLIELRKKYKKADFITGKETLPTDQFNENGITFKKFPKEDSKYFLRTRIKNIYIQPHVLIKKIVGNSIPIVYIDRYLTFKDRIIGISAPRDQSYFLKNIVKLIIENKKNFCFLYLMSQC